MSKTLTFDSIGISINFLVLENYPEYIYLTPETKNKLKSLILYDIDFEIPYIIIKGYIFPISKSDYLDVIGEKGLMKLLNKIPRIVYNETKAN